MMTYFVIYRDANRMFYNGSGQWTEGIWEAFTYFSLADARAAKAYYNNEDARILQLIHHG